MPSSKQLWIEVCRANRLADKSLDKLTLDRLKTIAAELTVAAMEAENQDAKLRLQQLYEDLTVPVMQT